MENFVVAWLQRASEFESFSHFYTRAIINISGGIDKIANIYGSRDTLPIPLYISGVCVCLCVCARVYVSMYLCMYICMLFMCMHMLQPDLKLLTHFKTGRPNFKQVNPFPSWSTGLKTG